MAIREEDEQGVSTRVGEGEWLFVTPELPVADVRATQAYYRDVLGFRIAWLYEESYGAVYNGKTELFLRRESGPIERCCVFVRVEDADRVLAAYREREVKIVAEIASQPWGMREFTIEENNGHRFRIGHSEGPVRPSSAGRTQG
ncbi:VOC family protein [Myxococcota bacterium]|nr:VOC family protein [Myxococcota bacterium]